MSVEYEKSELYKLRHTASHVLAMAVLEFDPEVKLAIGPPIEDGFYYDFEFSRPVSDDDLAQLEKTMAKIIKADYKVEHKVIPRRQAIAQAKAEKQPYKQELMENLTDEELSHYGISKFWDLCRGPHLKSAGQIKAFKLLKLAGAYWRGDENQPMLTRIYGTAFESQKELDKYLEMLEEAKKRDHRKLGKELKLFIFHETSPGMPYWLPNGVILLNELIRFWRVEHENRGYQEIRTPLINKKELYTTSGHWDHYLENMFISKTEDDEIYALKPMNCPNAMVVFGSDTRSYKDLPLRLSDTDTLHRFERSGTLNGLLRVREFSQDDAHIFVTEDQIKSEYQQIFEIAKRFYSIFNLDYSFRLGTRPKKYMGEVSVWDKAESALLDILKGSKQPYTIEEGDGAFYGPKIDIMMKDFLGRNWQTGTIQLDFQLPQRFNLKYTAVDGSQKTPVVIHRVIYGSFERFIGILLEHTGGEFPFWLTPVQIKVLPVSEKVVDYAREVSSALKRAGLRIALDGSDETLGKRIRSSELEKVPYILVVGEKEAEAKTVTVRVRHTAEQTTLSLEDLLKSLPKAS